MEGARGEGVRRGRSPGRFAIALGVLASLALAAPASAQTCSFSFTRGTAKDTTVVARGNPDYQPIGLELGNFILHPALTDEVEYNDNIFRDTSYKSDFINRLKPSLGLTGDVADRPVSLTAEAEIGRNKSFVTEGYEDFNFVGSVQQDITDDSNVHVVLRRARIHEARGTINDPGRAFGPTQYDLTSITLCPQISTAGPFFNSVKLEGRLIDYLPTGTIDNSERSNRQLLGSTRFGYEFDQGWTAFVEPSYEIHQFIKRVDSTGLNHDTQIYQVLTGITYDATADLFVELGVGYFYQPFFTPRQVTQGGLALNGTLAWNFAENATLSGTLSQANQNVQPFDTTLHTSTLVSTTGVLRLDYAPGDRVLTFASAGMTNDAYGGAPLTEDTLSFQVGASYLFNEYLSAGLTYYYDDRTSTLNTRRFTNNRVVLRVTGQL